ncbi:MAG: L,D-transpeptidase [Microbacterium sp.]
MTSRHRRRWTITAAAVLAAAVIVVGVLCLSRAGQAQAAATPEAVTTSATPTATIPAVPAVDAATVQALPEARYDAVIGGLLAFDGDAQTTAKVYTAAADLPLFGQDRVTPVARLAATDFLDEATPVVVVQTEGPWALVLTPARRVLPSDAQGTASAQTAAWTPLAALTLQTTPTSRVVISTTAQTVQIVAADGTVLSSFGAAVGAADTPTPTGVVGYLEARYTDPSQGTGDQPIQLTSLHSTAADEPYGGSDGGLIGVHYWPDRDGAISHGCVRVDSDAIAALSALPLGTLVEVV